MRLSEELLQNDNVYIDNETDLVIEQESFRFDDDVSYYAYNEPDVIEIGSGAVLVSNEIQGDILIRSDYGIVSMQTLHDEELYAMQKELE